MGPEGTAALIWIIIGAAALALLHALAAMVQNETQLHRTRVRVAQLRAQYAKRLAGEQTILEVDEDRTEEPARKAA